MTERLQQIEAFAQRGLSDSQILLSVGGEKFAKEELKAIEKGRTAGMALIHDKMFNRAMNGDMKAIEYLKKKFEEIKNASRPQPKSYIETQLDMLRNLKS